jgi:hypothetical protein
MTELTTLVTNFLGVGLVILPPPLLEDLAEALDDERHFLVVELGGVDGDSTWSRIFFLLLRCFECNGLCFGRGRVTLLDDLLEPLIISSKLTNLPMTSSGDIGHVCFSFWQLLATKSCCGLPNAQLFSQLL